MRNLFKMGSISIEVLQESELNIIEIEDQIDSIKANMYQMIYNL